VNEPGRLEVVRDSEGGLVRGGMNSCRKMRGTVIREWPGQGKEPGRASEVDEGATWSHIKLPGTG
jgi:hypothetical protein